jgi:hypothetical protein
MGGLKDDAAANAAEENTDPHGRDVEQPAHGASAAGQLGDDGPRDVGVSTEAIIKTTTWCAVFAVLGHLVVYGNYLLWLNGWQPSPPHEDSNWIPWQPPVGIALALVATVAFGGFYAASQRARVAIAASFLLTFLVLLTFEVTIGALSQASGGQYADGGAVDFVHDLRGFTGIIVGFYFGTEAAISVAKVLGVAFGSSGDKQDILRSDRDVARVPADSVVSKVFKFR